MGASNVTTELQETGNGEVVDGDRSGASDGHVAKKRKRQKALAAVPANGHVSKVALRKTTRPDGAVSVHEAPAGEPGVDARDLDDLALNGHAVGDVERNGATVEAPADHDFNGATVEDDFDDAELDGATIQSPAADDHEDAQPAVDDAPPADGRRKRAAKRAKGVEEPLRARAAKRARAAQLASPAGRRALLVATAAEIAAAAAVEPQPESTGRKRAAKVVRRLVALIAVAMVPASVYLLVVSEQPTSSLSRADAGFMSAQLVTADQRVRRQLVRLKPGQTSAAVARTRDATLTARSLALSLARIGGSDADVLRRALALESSWLDAVGSVLLNPRSALRDELVARDALLLPALAALPVPENRRKGGSEHLVRYAKSRVAAKSER